MILVIQIQNEQLERKLLELTCEISGINVCPTVGD